MSVCLAQIKVFGTLCLTSNSSRGYSLNIGTFTSSLEFHSDFIYFLCSKFILSITNIDEAQKRDEPEFTVNKRLTSPTYCNRVRMV